MIYLWDDRVGGAPKVRILIGRNPGRNSWHVVSKIKPPKTPELTRNKTILSSVTPISSTAQCSTVLDGSRRTVSLGKSADRGPTTGQLASKRAGVSGNGTNSMRFKDADEDPALDPDSDSKNTTRDPMACGPRTSVLLRGRSLMRQYWPQTLHGMTRRSRRDGAPLKYPSFMNSQLHGEALELLLMDAGLAAMTRTRFAGSE
jgi:hypothetical protein